LDGVIFQRVNYNKKEFIGFVLVKQTRKIWQ